MLPPVSFFGTSNLPFLRGNIMKRVEVLGRMEMSIELPLKSRLSHSTWGIYISSSNCVCQFLRGYLMKRVEVPGRVEIIFGLSH